jgi:hypothetical protein
MNKMQLKKLSLLSKRLVSQLKFKLMLSTLSMRLKPSTKKLRKMEETLKKLSLKPFNLQPLL